MDKVQEIRKRPHICKHDQLGRQCNICDLEEEVQDLQKQLDAAKQENERLRDSAQRAVKVANEYELENDSFQRRLKQAIEALEWALPIVEHQSPTRAEIIRSLIQEESIRPPADA